MYSHILLFGRDKPSKKIGQELGIDMDFVRSFRDVFSPVQAGLRLEHFPLYGSRLCRIQLQMNEWRPQSFSELFIRPYRDPMTFYSTQIAVIVGILSILALGATLAQTFAAFKAMAMLQPTSTGGLQPT
jgi:hypothetical protein